tara:strand:+ start:13513 stop:14286 length:774 start_codon:yes stop_codon:yes gene_type:complete
LKIIEFLKSSAKTAWEAFLNNAVVLITAFFLSGGYLVAINRISQLQDWVRGIPTDYVLTPLVLLLVALSVLVRINQKQKEELSKFQEEPITDESDARFVTHVGVWWKIYTDSEYIEDFPYCSCCSSRMKLVQTEWHPDEVYKCPSTNTEFKLYDKVPREKEAILESLYSAYFRGLGGHFQSRYYDEFHRLKELNPDIEDLDLCNKLFELGPLSKIPGDEKAEIFAKNSNPHAAYHFVERHYPHYKKYFKEWRDEQKK